MTDNKLALLQAIENFGRLETREKYFDLYDDNAVLRGYAGVGPGLENIKRFYAQFWTAFPDAKIVVEDLIEADDKLTCRFVVNATHGGNFLGVPATKKPVSLPGITILRFANGKCVERWSQTDFLGAMVQIGAVSMPA